MIGLLAANSIFKYKQREDVRADIGLFVLLILYSVLVGFQSFGWLMLIGGIVVGALVGAVLAYAPRQNRGTVQVVGLLGVVLLCLAAVTAKLVCPDLLHLRTVARRTTSPRARGTRVRPPTPTGPRPGSAAAAG